MNPVAPSFMSLAVVDVEVLEAPANLVAGHAACLPYFSCAVRIASTVTMPCTTPRL